MSKQASANLQFAALFFILLSGLVFLSLIFRTFFLLKESKFNGSSHFTLLINAPTKVQYVSFSPQSSTIGILSFKNTKPPSEIPIDAKIDSSFEFNKENLKTSLFKMIFNFGSQREVNFIDFFRLDLFSQTLKDSSIKDLEISRKTDNLQRDSVILSFFLDPQIQDEKLNIQVINSTEVYGLGNKFANLISNAGGNVILVSSGDLAKDSKLEYTEPSYTVDKLSKLLKIKKVKIEKKGLADVTLVIGDNLVH